MNANESDEVPGGAERIWADREWDQRDGMGVDAYIKNGWMDSEGGDELGDKGEKQPPQLSGGLPGHQGGSHIGRETICGVLGVCGLLVNRQSIKTRI